MGISRLACLFLLLSSLHSYADNIRLVTFYAPPFVNQESNPDLGTTYKIILDSFEQANLSFEVEFSPKSRALKSTKLTKDVCTFPLARSQLLEADFIWVGPIAISQYALYYQEPQPAHLFTISDAREFKIAAYEGYSVSQQLKEQGFNITVTDSVDQGIKMLEEKSVDYWLSDTRTAETIASNLAIPMTNQPFVFLTDIKYLACNKSTEPLFVAKLQSQISAMIASGKVNISFR
ncbi:transporter substrate-binding domain-containing protein [Vibrio makurazakiensis]|uniref:hypothetical protein n=1 Tax=Vibrio makurazakiensis TaxID=2910250 RepID=UPI003D10D9B8